MAFWRTFHCKPRAYRLHPQFTKQGKQLSLQSAVFQISQWEKIIPIDPPTVLGWWVFTFFSSVPKDEFVCQWFAWWGVTCCPTSSPLSAWHHGPCQFSCTSTKGNFSSLNDIRNRPNVCGRCVKPRSHARCEIFEAWLTSESFSRTWSQAWKLYRVNISFFFTACSAHNATCRYLCVRLSCGRKLRWRAGLVHGDSPLVRQPRLQPSFRKFQMHHLLLSVYSACNYCLVVWTYVGTYSRGWPLNWADCGSVSVQPYFL